MVQKCFCTPDGSMDPTLKIKYIYSRFAFSLTEILIMKQIQLFFETPCRQTLTLTLRCIYANIIFNFLPLNFRHSKYMQEDQIFFCIQISINHYRHLFVYRTVHMNHRYMRQNLTNYGMVGGGGADKKELSLNSAKLSLASGNELGKRFVILIWLFKIIHFRCFYI